MSSSLLTILLSIDPGLLVLMTKIACLAFDLEPFRMAVNPVVELGLVHTTLLGFQSESAMFETVFMPVVMSTIDGFTGVGVEESAVWRPLRVLLDRSLSWFPQRGTVQLERLKVLCFLVLQSLLLLKMPFPFVQQPTALFILELSLGLL